MQISRLPKTIWQYNAAEKRRVDTIADTLEVPDFVAAILVQRGIQEVEAARLFLYPSLSDLHDPFLLNDMDRAVERIRQALLQQERILVCGDYDVDGITSATIMKRSLSALGAEVFTYLPNRMNDGYGFHDTSIEFAQECNAKLLITVDCGITATNAVNQANELGMDVIITDHHEPNGPLPAAYAILNPKRLDSTYPEANLAGIGVAFKLVQALIKKGLLQFPLSSLLELVALGTVADVANLMGENRILVHFGLESLTHTSQEGLKALMKVSGVVHGRRLDPFAIGYQLGPRLNAVGRLGSPEQALELLLTTDPETAEVLANQLNSQNQKRQTIEEEILHRVEDQVASMDLNEEPFIVAHGEGWHEGVIGIVASKITDRHFRPTCVISVKNGVGKGSGRSIPSFSLFDCLSEIDEHLIEFGGHQIAAGFQILPEKIEAFRQACIRVAHQHLTPEDLIPKTNIDTEIRLRDISFETIKSMNRLAPFGLGNPKPVILFKQLRTKYPPRSVGNDGNHLKLVLTDGRKHMDAIAFNFGQFYDRIRRADVLDIVATPEINVWNGREYLQLHIHDINPHFL